MRKLLLIIVSFLLAHSALAFEITVNLKNVKSDSLFIYSYTDNYRWEKSHSFPFAEKTVLQSKQNLSPGMYILSSDSISMAFFIISGSKTQKFTIHYEGSEVSYEGSVENTENQSYLLQMDQFAKQLQILSAEYTAIVNGNDPKELQDVKITRLAQEAEQLDSVKRDYQLTKAAALNDMLLASVIRGSVEAPKPPVEAMVSRDKFENYVLEHHFDYFPWEDSRILKTPVAINKFKDYAYLISNVSKLKSLIYFEQILEKIKQYPEAYNAFFDYMEKGFGDQNSPLWSQDIYLLMLRDALKIKELPASKKTRYEQTIARLDKNNAGDLAPDFTLLLSNGDTTRLHDVKAEYMILYLQNPDCPTCKEVRDAMAELPVLNRAIANGKLKVLTVYFEQNENLWRNYLNNSANPKYIHGWDYKLDIENKKLYDTNIIPYMYLLDNEKRIIVKDILVSQMDEFLKTLNL